MSDLVRFGVSIEKDLLDKFDKLIDKKKYQTRSKAIADLIREELIEEEALAGAEVAGAIMMVFNHHKREISETLTAIQHDYFEVIISSQHIHLDADNCLEIVIVKGKPKKLKTLANKLKANKGVKHLTLNLTTTGKNI